MGPEFLAKALETLPQSTHPDLLVGFNKADDAGIFRISDDLALVQTVDFFPPIVDDPFQFGQIAAANALSDVFAMGGRPLTAMNIVGFPLGKMPPEILTEILRGGSEKVEEAGAVIVGGHSIKDQELKYGVAVTGIVDPKKIITNAGAQVGDRIFLTKPLGTGLVTTGIKRGAATDEQATAAIEQMTALNQSAAELMIQHKTHAATDITGFGLLGHAYEMASASGVTLKLFFDRLPLLPGALELAEKKMIPGGAIDNRKWLSDKIRLASSVDEQIQAVMFDPQTSGGLLIVVGANDAGPLVTALEANGLPSAVVGSVETPGEHAVVVE